jgi:ActR/RegA family two-component response regulator
MTETILIVDDEEPVRTTLREWLESAGWSCQLLTAADAESALVLANQHAIDLAILDWNLGAGSDGLQLLEDLSLFHPDVVAILITGYAHQATPLDAMRMGVRDYLDKNQDLNRETFLAAVRRQLDRIGPAKRERRLHTDLAAFRAAVEKVLPLVQSAAALNDPLPLPEAIRSLFRFLLRATGASDGVLLVHSHDPNRQPVEICRVYDAAGQPLAGECIPFARSLAGSVVSLGEPSAMTDLAKAAASATVELQPFERGCFSVLAAPLPVGSGLQVVLELFDKQDPQRHLIQAGFDATDHRLVAAAAEFGTEMLRQALAERQTHRLLLDAVGAALAASDSVAETLRNAANLRPEEAPPAPVLDRLREGLRSAVGAAGSADETLRLVEAIRVLSLRHGAPAIQHCTRLVEDLRSLLDTITQEKS